MLANKEDVLDRWREHFDTLLNEGLVEAETLSQGFPDNDGEPVLAPTRQETIDAINSLKNNKSPGSDSIPAELFKSGGEELIDFLHEIILQIWNEEILPEEWLVGLLCPLHKKGER